MTWIVGTPTMFGYGIGISDVRVTVGNDTYDCLQKIHSVGRFIAMGFAGSVRIGFAMVDTLSALLHLDDELKSWDPNAVAQWWPADAREIFAKFPAAERVNQCHLMMISVHPTETHGASWARAFVHIFKSPEFEAVPIPVHKVGAIGCGTDVGPCREAVETLSSDSKRMFGVMRGETGCQGGMANRLGFELTKILKQTQPMGISSHLNYCWVYRKKVIIKTNDHWVKGRWTAFDIGSGINDPEKPTSPKIVENAEEDGAAFAMPQLATTWDELVQVLGARGARADGCVATLQG